VSVVYSGRARASHFRPVLDIARIVRMVARRLVTQRLPALLGLRRSQRHREAPAPAPQSAETRK
jgi:hypothetical protein